MPSIEYMREYRKRNPDKIRQARERFQESHREELLRYWKDYYSKLPKGSSNDSSWNGTLHTCCGSKKASRHKKDCIINSDDLSDLKDKET